jgi:hypothetical protein
MIHAQSSDSGSLPYFQIPDYPEIYTPMNVAARMIDGLGYRYFWATEELREEDLDYKPSESSRTTRETNGHILGLSRVILNGVTSTPNGSFPETELSFAEERAQILNNLHEASNLLKNQPDKGLDEREIIFTRGERKSIFPFWNLINGPIADAIWHAGQIVSYRRASGNPINPNVSVFSGRTRE